MSKLKTKLKDILKNSGVKEPVTAPAAPLQKRDTQQAMQPPAESCRVAGQVVQLYHMRSACREAGHCLGLTQERDCNLFPVRPGWCRERVSMRHSVQHSRH